ncbi:MAG: class I SAM-dependent methyltransferase [Bacteroidota bacterium]
MKTPYVIYHPLEEIQAVDTHGQGWRGETVQESIDLCRYRLIEPFFRNYLPGDGKILEAGCGLGGWVFFLRNIGYDVLGIELSKDAIRMVREYNPDAPVFMDNVLGMNFPDKHFDAVISLGLLEHFEEGPQPAFREIRRILKDNGTFFVTVPIQNMNRRLVANPLKEFKRWLRKRGGVKYAFEEYRYTVSEFSNLLKDADYEILVCVPDEYQRPRCIGLFVDYPFLRHRKNKWELNWIGNMLNAVLSSLSPWLTTGGALWICRKKG